ncbi:MAG TPA: cation-translocating P-type ATPase [Candidatus Limiplasma pullistercoris]|nr:cation-translocating P-type ATPase [Candidatus Limiplasma pullistercoris]
MKTLVQKTEAFLEWGGIQKEIALLAISGAALVVSIFDLLPLPFDAAWVAIVLCGVPIVLEALIGLITAFDIKADVLVSLALIASVLIGEDFAAGEVAFIMQLGALLEDVTVARARAGIEKLVHLTPQTARLLLPDGENIVPAGQVRVGDRLRVLPGESIPVDGVITSGQTSINQAVMTGESLPVDKTVGDEVSSGTVNQYGAFEMRATKVGEDSSIQRMIRLVQSADAGKARIVGLADRWATWIVVIALTAAALTWLITGEIIRAVTILVVFCPCALVLATPTAIMAAIGNATRHGFLVREGDALERLADVRKIAFDKTGTLTWGTPRVVTVASALPGLDRAGLYALAAGAERLSEHPLGKAVVAGYREETGCETDPATAFDMLPGRGVSADVDGRRVLAGNPQLLAEHGVTIPADAQRQKLLEEGCTMIYMAVDGAFAGYIALSDTLREESAATIAALEAAGVRPVLLTGDHERAAGAIAARLGIREVRAGCRPEEKLEEIDRWQRDGMRVCMIGDGINDAPALKKADVGIAMGGVGSDIAVEAADIALVDDEVKELPHLMGLSRRMMTTIRMNLTFSMGLNFLSIVLAMTGALNPVVGALVHNAGSVAVILNSALLIKWRRR